MTGMCVLRVVQDPIRDEPVHTMEEHAGLQ